MAKKKTAFKAAATEIGELPQQIASLLQEAGNKKGLTMHQIAASITRTDTAIWGVLMNESTNSGFTIKQGKNPETHLYSHIDCIPEPNRDSLHHGGKYQGWELFSVCLRASAPTAP